MLAGQASHVAMQQCQLNYTMHLGLPNASLDFEPQNGPTLYSRVKVSTDEIRCHVQSGQKMVSQQCLMKESLETVSSFQH